jgi:hypothetical protein
MVYTSAMLCKAASETPSIDGCEILVDPVKMADKGFYQRHLLGWRSFVSQEYCLWIYPCNPQGYRKIAKT